jgi:hypothetical protein
MKMILVAVATLICALSQPVARAEEDLPSDWSSLLKGGFFPGGTIQQKLAQIASPDGRSVAVLFHREKLAPGGPPEPPKTLERWARLTILHDRKIGYDSGYENLNIYQMSPDLALDVAWSPDSKHLAYRHITSLRVVGRDGTATTYAVAPEGSAISSFRWIDNERLLVVAKKTNDPLDLFGKPYSYQGYGDRARDVRIFQLHLTKGKTERYRQTVDRPTFLFHAVDFCIEEISPKANRVAFSDGSSLCIYDDLAEKLVARIALPQKPAPLPPPQVDYPAGASEARPPQRSTLRLAGDPQLEGVWWQNNDTVVIGLGLLSSPDYRKAFFTYDVPTKSLIDRSKALLPAWFARLKANEFHGPNWLYADPQWFQSALKR